MTNENECGCRLPCGVCMVTNRRCPMVPTINDFVYNKEGNEYLRRDEKLTEELKAKINEQFGYGKEKTK